MDIRSPELIRYGMILNVSADNLSEQSYLAQKGHYILRNTWGGGGGGGGEGAISEDTMKR